jgi:hypothetical protein
MSNFAAFGPVHFLRLRGALSIEVKTGMKNSRGSTMNYIRSLHYQDKNGNEVPISTKRTKRGVLRDLENFMISQMGMDITVTEL